MLDRVVLRARPRESPGSGPLVGSRGNCIYTKTGGRGERNNILKSNNIFYKVLYFTFILFALVFCYMYVCVRISDLGVTDSCQLPSGC